MGATEQASDKIRLQLNMAASNQHSKKRAAKDMRLDEATSAEKKNPFMPYANL